MTAEKPVRLSSKLLLPEAGIYRHWCPGCKNAHDFYVGVPAPRTNARWLFLNGNLQNPSFHPSMSISVGPYVDQEDPSDNIEKTVLCHYILTAGVINFLGDCQHELKGQQVILPDFPEHAI